MPSLPASSSISRLASRASDDPNWFFCPEPERHIKDTIYDLIPVAYYLTRFIDSKHFQRLRNVKQLGTTSYVWPGAQHSRFEHSLGVAYLARCLASHLQTSQPELGITDRDVACVEIAGLCHDLGHGPWSHVWDGIFMKTTPASGWTHEEGSVMMFDDIIKEYSIPMSKDDTLFVKALIAGEPAACNPKEKRFLFDIVANKRNGIDVDKFDYIQRDSRMLGESMSISLTRILKSARVIGDQICYNIKDAESIYNICVARFSLHKRFYNHKTAKAIEYMIVDALKSAESHMKIAERVFDPKKFLHLTDIIMPMIEASTEPELEKARQIFTRIRERDLYKCVDYKVVDWRLRKTFEKFITPERIVEASRSIPRTSATSVPTPAEFGDIEVEQMDANIFEGDEMLSDDEILQPGDIVVDFAAMHHGMKDKNPLDSVRFYSKTFPNVSMPAGPGVYSGLLPSIFAEVMLRIYTKKPKFFGLVQAGFRAVLAEMDSLVEDIPIHTEPATRMPTPPTSTHGDDDMETERALSKESSVYDLSSSTEVGTSSSTPAANVQPLPKTPREDTKPLPGEDKKRKFGRAASASFTPNPFTSVQPNFAPASPTARGRSMSKSLSKVASFRRKSGGGGTGLQLGPAIGTGGGLGSGDAEGSAGEEDWSLGLAPAVATTEFSTSGGSGRVKVGAKRAREDEDGRDGEVQEKKLKV